MFDDILTSIQRWLSNAKLKLNANKSEYMTIRKCKNVIRKFFYFCQKMVTTVNR